MKVVYTVEQKRKAVATYRRLKSCAATIRQLGYPSRHVLFDWVRESGSVGRPKKRVYKLFMRPFGCFMQYSRCTLPCNYFLPMLDACFQFKHQFSIEKRALQAIPARL